jgi:hypothetical protein
MRPPLAARLSRALVACYPPRWKQRYREEMLDVLDQHQASPRTVLSLAGGALTAHLDPSYRPGTLDRRSRLHGRGTSAARDTWDEQPALAPDDRTIVDGSAFGRTAVDLWELPFPAP